jgi:hypothetical protein
MVKAITAILHALWGLDPPPEPPAQVLLER